MPIFAQLFEFPPTPAALAAVAVWIFVIGSAIGSFLNVVIYRMPQGMNIAHPGSRCPQCGAAIRWYHNLPIAGWLILRGRCYDCRATIAVRYPLVEALVAGVFLVLAAVDVLPYLGQGVAGSEPYSVTEKIRWLQWLCHATLMSGLVAVTFIDVDGQRLPRRLWGVIAAVGAVLPAIWPEIRTTHYLPYLNWPKFWEREPPWPVGLWDGGAGLLAAALLAWPATVAPWFRYSQRHNAVYALLWVGLFLGWQPVAVLACLTATTYLGLGAVGSVGRSRFRLPWTGWLTVFTLGWLLAWRLIGQWLPLLV